MTTRHVALTLSLESTSDEDAVRQFITAIGLYGMGNFNFQVFEEELAEERMVVLSGREAMLSSMPDVSTDERQEIREDDVRSDLLNDPGYVDDPDYDEHITEQYGDAVPPEEEE